MQRECELLFYFVRFYFAIEALALSPQTIVLKWFK